MGKSFNLLDFLNQTVVLEIEKLDYEVVDVEYQKEGGNWFLRFFIDQEGGIDFDDCQKINDLVSQFLDLHEDKIEHAYFLEISSPGLERPLKKEADFNRFQGKKIQIKLFAPLSNTKKKNFIGILEGLEEQEILLNCDDEILKVPLKILAKANLVYDFEN